MSGDVRAAVDRLLATAAFNVETDFIRVRLFYGVLGSGVAACVLV